MNATLPMRPSAAGVLCLVVVALVSVGPMAALAQTYDYGDAPDSHGTLSASNGPYHTVSASLYIGALVDAESDGQPTLPADGDDLNGVDDDDGVDQADLAIVSGQSSTVTVTVFNNTGKQAHLAGWIDWDVSRTFEASERFMSAVPSAATPQTVVLDWGNRTIPPGVGLPYARFRLGPNPGKVGDPTGFADEGEVEDYRVTSPTLAAIGSFGATAEDGSVVVRWTTALEDGTAGFFLERYAGGGWVRVTGDLLLADPIGSGMYSCVDPGAENGGTYTYRLIELENTGGLLTYGPYAVTVGTPGAPYADWASASGLDPWDPAVSGPDADPDGDGQTNVGEWRAGTDPMDPASALRIVAIEPTAAGTVSLRWTSEPGRAYIVESAPGAGVPFAPLFPEGLPATPPENEYTGAVDAAAALFRIVVIQP